jgi:30S ribosomal protein S31
MGKGDKKSRKGKISMGSYGVSRPRKKAVKKAAKKTATAKKAAPAKKAAAPKKAAKKAE